MDLQTYLRGFAVGIALAAPIGPIAILVLKRSLEGGALVGIASGLGVAVADAIFATLAALGLAELGSPGWLVRIAGGLFLVGLGARTFFTPAPKGDARAIRVSPRRAFVTTLLYTLANPVSILTFAAVAASLHGGALPLVTGVFSGSLVWWLILASAAALIRSKISARLFAWGNKAAGIALVLFGLFALAQG